MKKQEQGFILITALVFLILLTLLGMTTMSTGVLQEKEAQSYGDRVVAINAADSMLVACEQIVLGWTALPEFAPADPDLEIMDGLHFPSEDSYSVADPYHPDWFSTDVIPYTDLMPALTEVKSQPLCVIEHLNTVVDTKIAPPVTKEYFRVSARGTGYTDSAAVVARSIIERVF